MAKMPYTILIAVLLFAVCKTSGAFSVNCVFQTITTIPEIGSTYVCTGTLSAEGLDSDILTDVKGTHQSGKSHKDVQGLFINYQTMRFFPRNITAFFPKITALQFMGAGIFEVTNNHLSPFPNLTYLNLDNNLITTLDSDLFSGIESMKVISLNANKLMYIGHDFLSNGTATISSLLMRNSVCVHPSHDTATTPGGAVDYLLLRLRATCPPSTSQIEASLKRQFNSQAQSNSEIGIKVQSLVDAVDKCSSERDSLQQSLSKMEEYMKTNQNLVTHLVNRLSRIEQQSLSKIEDYLKTNQNLVTNLVNRLSQIERKVALCLV